MDFLILKPLSPKTGYHFFERGGGWVGVKSFRSEGSKQWGGALRSSPLLGAESATDKKPKLCVSVCLTAGLAD